MYRLVYITKRFGRMLVIFAQMRIIFAHGGGKGGVFVQNKKWQPFS